MFDRAHVWSKLESHRKPVRTVKRCPFLAFQAKKMKNRFIHSHHAGKSCDHCYCVWETTKPVLYSLNYVNDPYHGTIRVQRAKILINFLPNFAKPVG